MSYKNRQEDIDNVKALKVGECYEFNKFQEGGAEIRKVSDCFYELYELKMYCGTPVHDRSFDQESIEEVINEVYNQWT